MASDVPITPELVRQHGLSEEEYRPVHRPDRRPGADAGRARHRLGDVERALLPTSPRGCTCGRCRRRRPSRHPGPGRRERRASSTSATAKACVFKMESAQPSRPSSSPIRERRPGWEASLRDVFTMGARPIAVLNALRFGAPDHPEDAPSRRRGGRPGSAATAIPSGCRRWGALSASIRATMATCWSTPWPSASRPNRRRSSTPRRPASGIRSSTLVPRRGATASTGPRWPRPRSTRNPSRQAPHGAGRRPFRREAPARGLPGADGVRVRGGGDPGHGRGRADLLGGGGWAAKGDLGSRAGPGRRADARGRDERLRDDAVGEPGAHAHGARSREGR